jgi:hypothetical protein
MNTTPAPWKTMLHNTKENRNRTWTTGIHTEINLQFATVTDSTREKAEATARLIAAAPELLEAVETLMGSLCEAVDLTDDQKAYNQRWQNEIKKAREAIAKATASA